ncbi:unnamed protein product [Pieris macdunnoughi]|uniref:C2H2-type domain-containing protein n=1 Tax=Pieris macdunnoughi TaxID=345717 RepID=A0A821VTB1_9NEOP|nr:unnamed protein product [Pieris macdunnoughi]
MSDQPVFIDVSTGIYDTLDTNNEIKIKEEVNFASPKPEIDDLLTVKSNKFKCPECNYLSRKQELVDRHILKVHRGENPFQCFMCDYTTSNKGNFAEHIRRHEGKKPFKCSYCPHRNVSKKNLKKHELIHRPDNPLKCPHCDYISKHQREFGSHTRKFHSTQNGVLTCVKCQTTFDDQDSLTDHVKSQLTCEKCTFVACDVGILEKHLVNHRQKRIEKKKSLWTCSICSWSSCKHPKILLHLIHHPNQEVNGIDISILQKHGIM